MELIILSCKSLHCTNRHLKCCQFPIVLLCSSLKNPKQKRITPSHMFHSFWAYDVSQIIKNPQVNLNFLISCIFTCYFLYCATLYSVVCLCISLTFVSLTIHIHKHNWFRHNSICFLYIVKNMFWSSQNAAFFYFLCIL